MPPGTENPEICFRSSAGEAPPPAHTACYASAHDVMAVAARKHHNVWVRLGRLGAVRLLEPSLVNLPLRVAPPQDTLVMIGVYIVG